MPASGTSATVKVLIFFAMRTGPTSATEKISRLAPAIDRFGNAIKLAPLTRFFL